MVLALGYLNPASYPGQALQSDFSLQSLALQESLFHLPKPGVPTQAVTLAWQEGSPVPSGDT